LADAVAAAAMANSAAAAAAANANSSKSRGVSLTARTVGKWETGKRSRKKSVQKDLRAAHDMLTAMRVKGNFA